MFSTDSRNSGRLNDAVTGRSDVPPGQGVRHIRYGGLRPPHEPKEPEGHGRASRVAGRSVRSPRTALLSQGQPTKLVRDQGREAYDPSPNETAPAAPQSPPVASHPPPATHGSEIGPSPSADPGDPPSSAPSPPAPPPSVSVADPSALAPAASPPVPPPPTALRSNHPRRTTRRNLRQRTSVLPKALFERPSLSRRPPSHRGRDGSAVSMASGTHLTRTR
jgi:hypothetical protein